MEGFNFSSVSLFHLLLFSFPEVNKEKYVSVRETHLLEMSHPCVVIAYAGLSLFNEHIHPLAISVCHDK